MLIPRRDWLLLRGRMRAVAKIPVLPVALKSAFAAELDRPEDEHATPADEQSREG